MAKKYSYLICLIPVVSVLLLNNHTAVASDRYVMTDRQLLQELKLEPMLIHEPTGAALIKLSPNQRETLALQAHEHNRCAGHELIGDLPASANVEQARDYAQKTFQTFDQQLKRDHAVRTKASIGIPTTPGAVDPVIESAVAEVSEQNLRDTVAFLSTFQTRNHKSADAGRAINAFKQRIQDTLKDAKIPYSIDLISHRSTPMNSLRLSFKGTTKPNDIVVAGGHIDSINNSFFGSKSAPGSDDNASGSANLLEAARILAQGSQPARTIEFYWYAGEEGGLLGSAEIAASAKSAGRNVVGVLQLDMTLFPGDGEFTLGSMTDFTSQEMRDLLVSINRDYIHATIIEDKCGYGCSDHASWYKNGFPTLMPFEATAGKMNRNIHSDRDTVNSSSSYRHSAMFSKIAVAFLLSLSR